MHKEVAKPTGLSQYRMLIMFVVICNIRTKGFVKTYITCFRSLGSCKKGESVATHAFRSIKKDFLTNEEAIGLLKPSDLLKAAGEESRRIPFSNPSVRSLRKHITSVHSEVMGMDESRVGIRSKVWSLTAAIGPPSLWITINPSNTGDPIAQVLAGVNIALDRPRCLNKIQHHICRSIHSIEIFSFYYQHCWKFCLWSKLIEIEVTSNVSLASSVRWQHSTVKAQGKGTLYFYVICLMKGTPSAD